MSEKGLVLCGLVGVMLKEEVYFQCRFKGFSCRLVADVKREFHCCNVQASSKTCSKILLTKKAKI